MREFRNKWIGRDITVTLGGAFTFSTRVLDIVRNLDRWSVTMSILDEEVLEFLAPYQDIKELTGIVIDQEIYSDRISYYICGSCLAIDIPGYTRIPSIPYR